MAARFNGVVGAFAYLLFVLLYAPCVSTIATIAREIGWRWAWFSVLWTTLLAYSLSVMFYQLATMGSHVWTSLSWVFGLAGFLVLAVWIMRWSTRGQAEGDSHAA